MAEAKGKQNTITLFMPPETVKRLDAAAEREDRSRSSVARRAIESYLEKVEQREEAGSVTR